MKWSERFWMFAFFTSFALVGATIAGIFPARAADLPALKAKPAVVAPAPAAPFYVAIFGGLGLSPTENELTFLGVAQGPVKTFPTGLMAGGELGYQSLLGPALIGVYANAAYDFSRGDVGCMSGFNVCGSRKNGLFMQQGAELGIPLGTLYGYVPTAQQPTNWPIPITVPTSAMANLAVLVRGGVAERQLTLCAATDLFGDQACGSKFLVGGYAGLKLQVNVSANLKLFGVWDHVFWDSSFTPQSATPLFANVTTVKQEDVFKLGGSFGL